MPYCHQQTKPNKRYQNFDLNVNWNLSRDFLAAFPTNTDSDLAEDWERELAGINSTKNMVVGDRDYQNHNFQASDRY